MNMRRKVLIIVAALMAGVFVILFASVNLFILPSYAALEKQKTTEAVTRTNNLITAELADVSSKVSDWAFWDDTYAFVQTANESYINSNLDNSVFANLRLNLMLFVNASGGIVYGKAVDLTNNAETEIPQGINEELSSRPELWNFTSIESETKGLLLLPQEPLMFSSKPILTSNYEGPIDGALIMGRYIDSSEISYLSSTLQIPLTITRFNDPQIQQDFQIARSSLSASDPIFVEPINADSVGGYSLISDVFSNPALILRIDLPRDIYKQGLSTVNNFLVLIAGVCMVFGTAMIILLEQGMLSPLSKLTNTVKEMGKKEFSPTSRFLWNGPDETEILAEAIKDTISQRLAAIEELAGMVGHDLRNPLTSINSAAYYIKRKSETKIDPGSREMLNIIEQDVAYADKIVNDLLEYSRKIQLQYVDTTPKTLTAEALSLMNVPKNVKLIDLTQNETEITVDSDKMKRVFVNLIKNGIDAMPEGGSMTIESTRVNDGIKITFSDTGSGMSEETLRRIGTPLFTTKAKGMGFGLSISKRFVEAHGGSLTFESTIDKGTTATISLKTKQKAETKDDICVELPTPRTPPA